MKVPSQQRQILALVAVILPLLLLFAYVAIRSGPLAPVAVTVMQVESQPISPALFGIGTVGARYNYKIGPTTAGRVKQLYVDVGDRVEVGQVLGEMDPVDSDARIRALQAALKATRAAVRQAEAKAVYARSQARRYEKLLGADSVSEEQVATKRQELAVAEAALAAARDEVNRIQADIEALHAQRGHLKLISPVVGLVVAREANPGSSVMAGQAVVEVIDPTILWIDTRFDQISAAGLATGLPAMVRLRSRHEQRFKGRVLRLEPLADSVTQEMLAKIVFEREPLPMPPLGELAEVTVSLPSLPARPVIPNAAIREVEGRQGVWLLVDDGLRFVPVELGCSDLDGRVQVLNGLKEGQRIVVYSEKALTERSRINVVEQVPGVVP
ncbi:MAG TPA: efflux RND transporter periplasmic adaptor subunit [Thiolapillus brandeum]|uniref:Efflux RND transporter periplasmic adaptor subunit n=1 Tax=Thiolapillus brandeum TaxID=1076588 RepID=A0A831WGG9_9GAMM|nr:efflux RND transporter periplasmic adaptor subunit [Thiolapillus brandeum]